MTTEKIVGGIDWLEDGDEEVMSAIGAGEGAEIFGEVVWRRVVGKVAWLHQRVDKWRGDVGGPAMMRRVGVTSRNGSEMKRGRRR